MDFQRELMALEWCKETQNKKYEDYVSISQAFGDSDFVNFVGEYLPKMVMEVERRGTMEVGKDRETAIIVMFDVALGASGPDYCPVVDECIDPMEKEVDVIMFGKRVSIKTRKMVSKNSEMLPGFKATWSSDRKECQDYIDAFIPSYDILYLPVNWGQSNFLYYFTEAAQLDVLNQIGKESYFRIGSGKDPKGLSVTDQAVRLIAKHPSTLALPISWPELDESLFDKVESRCHDVIACSLM